MLYLCTALYAEAAPFVEALSCKKDPSYTHSQIFGSEDALVLVTGSGSISAAIALTEVLAKCPPQESDLLVNIGICGCTDRSAPIGQLCRIPKITDATTGYDYYPDLLYRHDLPEFPLVTSPTPMVIQAEENPSAAPLSGTTQATDLASAAPTSHKLYDMEAAGIFLAARRHFPAHCMYFYKIVSDHCDGTYHLTADGVSDLAKAHVATVLSELRAIASASTARPGFSSEEEQFVQMLCETLQCSVTMASELRKLLLYYKLEHGDAISFAKEFLSKQGISLEEEAITITRKKGKQLLEQLRNACLE